MSSELTSSIATSATPIAVAPESQSHATIPASEATGVNLERKARKDAAKALKAQQALNKKAAKAAQSTAIPSSSSSSTKTKSKPARAPQSPSEQLSRALAYILRHGADKEGLKIRPDGYVLLKDVLKRPRVKSVNMAEGQGDGTAKKEPGVQDVVNVTESNDKKRFEVMQETNNGGGDGDWWVRAVQGHSLKQVVELQHIPLTLDNLHLLSTKQKNEDGEGEEERDDDELASQIDAKLGIKQDEHKDGNDKVVEVVHGTYKDAWESILSSGGLKRMTRNHIHLAKGKFGQAGVISGMRKSANRLIYIDIKTAIADGIEFLLSSNGVVLTPGAKGIGVLSIRYFTKVEDQRGQVIWTPDGTMVRS
ncbi:related to TPT1 - tRNA 2`-phosphotransferase [Melanopsichium pennsylvanicum]|uniref:2'-phosphotransferase n=2 Tax=Melanopsichium pennsylvanicum TaxID=63383 RepID=A0AAJ5C8N4_9BASI|nr:related to TPT1-tRNA 2`-phosphotransferase [Melanopsichium pennsylvanicum 4]SNX87689.1 related to TPT1 - tRNA 2`-phosphotransferase [Melanopsichium pennsylvanicum]